MPSAKGRKNIEISDTHHEEIYRRARVRGRPMTVIIDEVIQRGIDDDPETIMDVRQQLRAINHEIRYLTALFERHTARTTGRQDGPADPSPFPPTNPSVAGTKTGVEYHGRAASAAVEPLVPLELKSPSVAFFTEEPPAEAASPAAPAPDAPSPVAPPVTVHSLLDELTALDAARRDLARVAATLDMAVTPTGDADPGQSQAREDQERAAIPGPVYTRTPWPRRLRRALSRRWRT